MRRDGYCRRRCGGAACLLAPRGSEVMRSLHDELAVIEDFRRAGSTRCAHVLAELANMKGCLAAAQFAQSLSRDELKAIGGTRGRSCASRPPGRPSTGSSGRSIPRRSRMCSAAGSPGRLPPTASASAAPTATATTRPWPSRLRRTLRAVELRRRRAGGHLLERTDVRGKVITRTMSATLITRCCGADHVFPVKGARNLRRHRPGDGWSLQGGKARLEQRVPLEDLINYSGRSPASSATASRRERAPAAQRAATTAPVHHHLI